jgi:tRNA pseudouridine synthase 10
LYSFKEATLTASGREDVDVLCLGKGRPFYMEIIHPKRFRYTQEELRLTEKEINDSTKDIAVRDLQVVTREQTKPIKEGEDAKTKCYEALCYSNERISENDIEIINNLKEVITYQKTPLRVLHRRSVMTREKKITDLKASLVDSHHFRVQMTTQAGAYVKEFVHGDLGRTQPSICTLLDKECDILELDVHAVNLDFPPEINYNSDCESK